MPSKKITTVLALALIVLAAIPVMAQMSANPPEVAAKIRAMGKNTNNEIIAAVRDLYVPLQARASKTGVKITKDEKYGPDERNRLDVYEPLNKSAGLAPILVFIHGGAFVAGDKSMAGSPFYDNIGNYFGRKGLLAVLPTYRLAPKHKWPAGAEDIASALKWIRANAQKFGGDRNNVFLMGHSAGAAHVATYIFHEELQLQGGDGVVGAILMSGLYDPSAAPSPAYFGEDRSKYPSMAAIRHLEGRVMPVFITIAEFDPYFFDAQAAELFQALCKRDKQCPDIKQLLNHNHMSEMYHINTPDESIGPDILDFVRSKAR